MNPLPFTKTCYSDISPESKRSPVKNYSDCDFRELFCREGPVTTIPPSPSNCCNHDDLLSNKTPQKTFQPNFSIVFRSLDYNESQFYERQSSDCCTLPQTSPKDYQDLEKIFKERSLISEINDEIEASDEGIWAEDQDKLLIKLATQLNYDWKNISRQFNNKRITPTVAKMRYQKLREIKSQQIVKFSATEDLMIAKYFDKYGSDWTQIAGHFLDKTAEMIKNRYCSFISKQSFIQEKAQDDEKSDSEAKKLDNQNLDDYFSPFQQHLGSDSSGQEITLDFIDYSFNNQDDELSKVKLEQSVNECFLKAQKIELKEESLSSENKTNPSRHGPEAEMEALKLRINLLKESYNQIKNKIEELKEKVKSQNCSPQKN